MGERDDILVRYNSFPSDTNFLLENQLKNRRKSYVMTHACIPAHRRLGQESPCEFEASLQLHNELKAKAELHGKILSQNTKTTKIQGSRF